MKILIRIILSIAWFYVFFSDKPEDKSGVLRAEPISLTFLILAATAVSVGTGLSYAAAQEQAANQKKLANYNAAVAEQTAALREKAGKAKTEEMNERRNRLLSSMTANRAKRGILSTGSPIFVELETAENMTLDALTEGYNVKIGVQQAQQEAVAYRMQAKSAVREGRLNAGTALFSGAGKVASLGYMATAGGGGGGKTDGYYDPEAGYMG